MNDIDALTTLTIVDSTGKTITVTVAGPYSVTAGPIVLTPKENA